MEPFEIMVSESQERMLAVVEPAKVDAVLALLRALGDRRGGGRRGHRQRRLPGAARRRGGRRDAGRGAGRRAARSTTSSPTEPERLALRNRDARRSRRRRSRADDPATSCSPCSPRRTSPASAGRSSSTTRSSARTRSAGPRRPTPRCSHLPEAGATIAVAIDGNGRRVACDPYAGTVEAVLECAQNLACVGAEPLGLTNCLNFGNPEKPTRRLAARPLDARASPTPAARSGCRSSAATSRSTTRPRRARSTRRRWSAWSASCPTPSAPAGIALAAGDAIAICGPFSPSLAGSELAKLRGELGPGLPSLPIDAVRGGDRARPRGRARRRGRAPPTTSATAGSPARSPRWRSPAASGSTSTSTRWSSCAAARARRRCSARGPGGFVLAGDARRGSSSWPRDRAGRRVRDRRGGRRRGSRSRPPRPRSTSRSPTPSAPGARSASGSEGAVLAERRRRACHARRPLERVGSPRC